MNLFVFTHTLKENSPRGSYHNLPRQIEGNYPFPRTAFFKKGDDYGDEKMTKIKLAWLLVTSFDKFFLFCNLHIFGVCFFVS